MPESAVEMERVRWLIVGAQPVPDELMQKIDQLAKDGSGLLLLDNIPLLV